MDASYFINYAILAAFLSLFTIEVGVATTALLWWDKYKSKLKRYINPIWAVNGTFAVFYVVNFEVTYPTLLPTAALVYIGPVLFGALFLILRNAFIAYSEVTKALSREKWYITIYAISTLVIAFVAISVLASAVSGTGVIGAGTPSPSIDLFTLFVNPFSLLLFVALTALSLFIATIFFDIKSLRQLALAPLALAVAIVIIDLYLYVPYMFTALSAGLPLLAMVVAVFALCVFSYYRAHWYAKELAFLGTFMGTILFGVLQYPYLFGGTQAFTGFLNNSLTSQYAGWITAIGGTFVVIALSYFVYINYFKSDQD